LKSRGHLDEIKNSASGPTGINHAIQSLFVQRFIIPRLSYACRRFTLIPLRHRLRKDSTLSSTEKSAPSSKRLVGTFLPGSGRPLPYTPLSGYDNAPRKRPLFQGFLGQPAVRRWYPRSELVHPSPPRPPELGRSRPAASYCARPAGLDAALDFLPDYPGPVGAPQTVRHRPRHVLSLHQA
jgi:hypothetical protein